MKGPVKNETKHALFNKIICRSEMIFHKHFDVGPSAWRPCNFCIQQKWVFLCQRVALNSCIKADDWKRSWNINHSVRLLINMLVKRQQLQCHKSTLVAFKNVQEHRMNIYRTIHTNIRGPLAWQHYVQWKERIWHASRSLTGDWSSMEEYGQWRKKLNSNDRCTEIQRQTKHLI